MKIDTFVRISKSVRMELITATSNELAILMMACLYNRKLQIIQVDEAEIDDRFVVRWLTSHQIVTHLYSVSYSVILVSMLI